jgi:glycosyltransferase involved in cell wall biosynthesis
MRWPFGKKASSNKEEARRFYNAKEYEKAEPFLDAMLKENPNDAWAMDVLSRLYMNTARHCESIDLIRRLISTKPDPDLFRRLIHAACVENDKDSVFRFANRVDWKNSDEDLLSKIYESFWPDERCVAFFSETRWSNEIPFPTYVNAEQLYQQGEIRQAIELLVSLVSREVVNESTLMFARQICITLGQVEMAHDLWANYLRHIDGELSRKRSLAKRLRSSKRYEEALEIAVMVLEENPDDLQMLALMTELGQYVEQSMAALEAYHRLDGLGEAKLYHLRRFAKTAIKAASVDDMLLAVQRLVGLDVDANATIRNAYTRFCDLKQYEMAAKVLELIRGTLLEIDLKAARALEEGNPEQAMDILDQGLVEAAEHISFLMRKGIALEAMGEVSDAISMFEQVLQLNPEHESASQRRLKCGLKIWPEEKYFDEITQVTNRFPENINYQFARLNYVLSVKKDYDLSIEIVNTCLNYHPGHQRSHLYFALVQSWRGEHKAARSSISKSLLRWPASNDVYITASQIEKNAGNTMMQLEHINAMLGLHALHPVHSSSPTHAITPEYLSTAPTVAVQDSRLVSIVMTTYKQDPLLDAAIASILNQSYQNIELVIVDDCSPDDNFSYLQQLAKNDARIRVFQMSKNGGTYLAKNFGMTQAHGEFIGFMDSDDYCHAQRIEYQVASLDAHPEVMGVTHDYFRIDESSDIEFRGIGALRMACISLLIRKEVVDEIGFFDSLRVGADTEYIERIEAHYGKDRRLRLRIPSMFMMLHSSSLTGGGPFHISWRSVTGHRLQHHRSFRTWHRKIKAGLEDSFVPRKIHVRPFQAPEEMKSTHYTWKEGMQLFSEMIKKRNHDWWKGKKAVWQKELSPKIAGRDYVNELGLKVPELYWKGEDLASIPSFERLPNQFVLKPEKGWSSNNVYCMKKGEDILTHTRHDRDSLILALSNDKFVSENKPTIMIEELLEPEVKQSDDGLPRDFKFYCFGDEIAMIHVALRKSEVNKGENEHQYYTPDFKIMSQRIMEKRDQGRTPIPRPDCWDEMVNAVRTIGRELGIYMRIDMYATNRGAVFGEFTPTPHGGNGYSDFADRYLGSFWKGEEGVE